MATRILAIVLSALVVAAPCVAREPRNCATPSSSFRHYHNTGAADQTAEQARAFDEISICKAASGNLSFALSVVGEKGEHCYVEGEAKPREKGVFVFLDRGFRLRIELVGDRVRISERSEPEKGRRYCGASASLGNLEFKRHSGPPAPN